MRYQRDCGYMMRSDFECFQRRAEDYTSDICQCTKDECNSAPSFSMTPALLFVLPVLRYLF